jgi:4-diphosphocytidyl-2-C-methyl-D-erythritol kinase
VTRPVRVTLRAHAKINLELRVLGTRGDGYHELRSIFQSIALHDRIACVARPGPFILQCSAPDVPRDERNLVWRAAAALWHAIGRDGDPRDVSIAITKRIPMQGGLGGGSADAAAAIVGLMRLWKIRPPAAEIERVAATTGADVPFFLCGGTALGLGRGDEIFPLAELPALWVVLAFPAFGVSTPEAFAWFDHDRDAALSGESIEKPESLEGGGWLSDLAGAPSAIGGRGEPPPFIRLINDLEGPVGRRHPEIAAIKAALRAAGAVAAGMSGSGSTVFGLFRQRRRAAAAVPTLAAGGWRAILTRTVTRAEAGSAPRLAGPKAIV